MPLFVYSGDAVFIFLWDAFAHNVTHWRSGDRKFERISSISDHAVEWRWIFGVEMSRYTSLSGGDFRLQKRT